MSTPETSLAVKSASEVVKTEAQSARQTRIAAFTPANLTEAIGLAKLIARSELAPKDFRNKPENCLIAMQLGAELGVAPMQAIQSIAVINGRPSIWGDLALAVVQVHPDYEHHKEFFDGQGESRRAVFQIKRKGHELHVVTFTVADAKTAKLWGKQGPWQTNPDRMLQMRARGFGLRDKFADAMKGLRLAEEAMDIPADTSEAKKQREAATLDVGVAALTPSAEPNRGHGNEGMQRSQPDEQPAPKQDPVMCGDCQKIDGHELTCKHYVAAEQDRKTSKPTTKMACLILDVRRKKKKTDGTEYLLLDVTDPADKQSSLFVWHKSLYEYLLMAKDKNMICEVATDGKFTTLEHILELAGVPFVDNKPAQQGTMPEREPGQDDEDF